MEDGDLLGGVLLTLAAAIFLDQLSSFGYVVVRLAAADVPLGLAELPDLAGHGAIGELINDGVNPQIEIGSPS